LLRATMRANPTVTAKRGHLTSGYWLLGDVLVRHEVYH
jgi:hypothetical protein